VSIDGSIGTELEYMYFVLIEYVRILHMCVLQMLMYSELVTENG